MMALTKIGPTITLLAVLLAPSALSAPPKRSPAGMPEWTLAPLVEKVRPAVVSIRATGSRRVLAPLPDRGRGTSTAEGVSLLQATPKTESFTSTGSGVVIDARGGWIVTNDHVTARATDIEVLLDDGRKLKARLRGTDTATDIALLQVDASNLSEVPFGDSDRLRSGDFVLAVGNPLGLSGSASFGIVSAKGRTDVGYETIEDFIQIDAAINKGNSGGALVNLKGELVGINTAAVGVNGVYGISFAVPSNIVRGVTAILQREGKVQRGILGIPAETLTSDLARRLELKIETGAVITRVAPGSPAAAAGIQAGDVVVSANGRRVRTQSDYYALLALAVVGSPARLSLVRGDATREVNLRFAEMARERTKITVSSNKATFNGLVIAPLEPGQPLYGDVSGAYVVDTSAVARLQKAGLQDGDVITGFDDVKLRNASQVIQAIDLLPSITRIIIERDGAPFWIDLPAL